jgi:hypothetical protein
VPTLVLPANSDVCLKRGPWLSSGEGRVWNLSGLAAAAAGAATAGVDGSGEARPDGSSSVAASGRAQRIAEKASATRIARWFMYFTVMESSH